MASQYRCKHAEIYASTCLIKILTTQKNAKLFFAGGSSSGSRWLYKSQSTKT